jgi:hypothetical protein
MTDALLAARTLIHSMKMDNQFRSHSDDLPETNIANLEKLQALCEIINQECR